MGAADGEGLFEGRPGVCDRDAVRACEAVPVDVDDTLSAAVPRLEAVVVVVGALDDDGSTDRPVVDVTDGLVEADCVTDGLTVADGDTEALPVAEASDTVTEAEADSEAVTDGEAATEGLTDAEAVTDGLTDGDLTTDAVTDGDTVTEASGERLAASDGPPDGEPDGEGAGLSVTDTDAEAESVTDALAEMVPPREKSTHVLKITDVQSPPL